MAEIAGTSVEKSDVFYLNGDLVEPDKRLVVQQEPLAVHYYLLEVVPVDYQRKLPVDQFIMGFIIPIDSGQLTEQHVTGNSSLGNRWKMAGIC